MVGRDAHFEMFERKYFVKNYKLLYNINYVALSFERKELNISESEYDTDAADEAMGLLIRAYKERAAKTPLADVTVTIGIIQKGDFGEFVTRTLSVRSNAGDCGESYAMVPAIAAWRAANERVRQGESCDNSNVIVRIGAYDDVIAVTSDDTKLAADIIDMAAGMVGLIMELREVT